jgi:hypothetical protein
VENDSGRLWKVTIEIILKRETQIDKKSEQTGKELGTTERVEAKSSVPCWKVTAEQEKSEDESETEIRER